MERYDVIVIGAGVAGLTAAATAARRGASTLVLDRMGAGGQVVTVDRIENFPGTEGPISGVELGPLLQEQAEEVGAELRLGEVTAVAEAGEGLVVTSDGEPIGCRALIVAAGSTRRKLGVPGEAEFEGRGVSHCASCDGPMFRGMKVVVVGGGDSAFDEALVLSEHAAQVTLVYRSAPRAQHATVARVRATGNVTERPRTTVTAVLGDDVVRRVQLEDLETGETTEAEADGVFVYVGLTPNTGFLGELVELDGEGRIRVDVAMRTSHPRVVAAGDIRAGSAALLATCAGDGATAALAAVGVLKARPDVRDAD